MNRPVATLSGFVVFLLLVCGVNSCGSIVNGSREDFTVMTAPSDATILVDSTYTVTGFYRGSLTRGSSHTVDVSREGYRTQHIRTGNSASGWFFGNLLGFSLYGMIPDVISGGAFTIKPNPLLVQLTPGSGPIINEAHYLDGYLQAMVPIVLLLGFVIAIVAYSPNGFA